MVTVVEKYKVEIFIQSLFLSNDADELFFVPGCSEDSLNVDIFNI